MVGKWPYSWGGGDYNGAIRGTEQHEKPFCNDKKVVGLIAQVQLYIQFIKVPA